MKRLSVRVSFSHAPAGRRLIRLSAVLAIAVILALSAAAALQAAPVSSVAHPAGIGPARPSLAASTPVLYLPTIFGPVPAPVTVLAAGDIACGTGDTALPCQQQATSDLLAANNPDLVLTLGDNQYECGDLTDFQNYYDKSWGVMKSRTRPSVGNHDYGLDTSTKCTTTSGEGYYTYFGPLASPTDPGCTSNNCKGYYSYDVGSWHVIVLNSICAMVPGGCGVGTPQQIWLTADLAAHPNKCTLAYWHYPRFTSGMSGTSFTNNTTSFWNALYAAGVDIVLNGQDHDYERFKPMDPNGVYDPVHGIREFVVGTGGQEHHPFLNPPLPTTEVRDDTTFGVLKLVLGNGNYSWRFLPVAGGTFTDSGAETCR